MDRFVGRSGELTMLDQLVEKLGTGYGSCLTVSGEPGIGKTRLVHELAERAAAHDFLVLSGRSAEFEHELPFGVLVDALDSHLAQTDGDALEGLAPESAAELAIVCPSLAPVGRPPPGLQVERYRLHRALRGLLEMMAASRPVVLLLEDLHWADEASIELLAHLLHRPPRGPVLIAFSHWSGHVPPRLESAIARVAHEGGVTRIELDPLSESEADGLLEAVEARFRPLLYRESGGNPLYLQELGRWVQTHGPGALAVSSTVSVGDARVPPAVRLAIADELASLSTSARLFLQGAAVAWEPFDPTLAAFAAGLDDTQGLPALDEVVGCELVHAADPSAAYGAFTRPLRFTFRHPIVRRAVYEAAGEAWRIVAHARVAEAFMMRGLPVALPAHHLERSARQGDEQAIALLIEAGEAAAPRAPAAAARWFAAALRLLPPDAGVERRLPLLVSLATALGVIGRTSECRALLDEALSLVPSDHPGLRAQTVTAVARLYPLAAGGRNARQLLSDALAEAADERSASALRLELSGDLWFAGEWDAMATCAEDALRSARSLGDRSLTALAEALLGVAEKERGDTARALAHLRAAREIVETLPNQELAERVEIITYVGYVESSLGGGSAAEELLERAIRIVRATGQELFLPSLTTQLGLVQLRLGRLAEAAETMQEALDATALLGHDRLRALALMVSCMAATVRRDLEGALATGEEAVAAAQRAESALLESVAQCLVGEALIECGEWEAGRRQILEHGGGTGLTGTLADVRPRVHALLAHADIGLGRLDAAEKWVTRAEEGARRLDLPARRADAQRASAELLLARGDACAAAELAAVAAGGYRLVEQPVETARAELLTGRALVAAGERDAALGELERAYEGLTACGAERHADEAARELRGLGRRVGRSGRRAAGSVGAIALSPRELEVARLVATGRTNRRIAEELFLSEKTVESHLRKIFEKIGIHSRADVGIALERAEPSLAATPIQ